MAHTESFKAQPLSPTDIAEETAANCFEEADKDGNGTLTFEEFKAWFQAEQAEATSAAIAVDDAGTIDQSKARTLFDRFDENQDGVLDFDEVRTGSVVDSWLCSGNNYCPFPFFPPWFNFSFSCSEMTSVLSNVPLCAPRCSLPITSRRCLRRCRTRQRFKQKTLRRPRWRKRRPSSASRRQTTTATAT